MSCPNTIYNSKPKHGNLTFPDIVDNNIMVITSVAHWQPHIVKEVEYIGTYFFRFTLIK
jgi:hypothetical protein